MQKWEYLSVISEALEYVGVLRVRYVNGTELDKWKKGPHLNEILNSWGEEGWELVSEVISFNDAGRINGNRLIFKRPKL